MKLIRKIKKWLFEAIEPFWELFLVIIGLCSTFFVIGIIAGSDGRLQDAKATDWLAAISSILLVFIGILSWRTAKSSNSTAVKVVNSQRKQDNYKNYMFHKEQFSELLSKLEAEHSIHFKDSTEFYEILFPSNSFFEFNPLSSGNDNTPSYLYEFSRRFTEETKKFQKAFIENEKKFNNTNGVGRTDRNNFHLIEFYYMLYNQCDRLGFHFLCVTNSKILAKEYYPLDIQISYADDDPLKHQRLVYDVYDALYKFCGLKTIKYPSLFLRSTEFEKILEQSPPFK